MRHAHDEALDAQVGAHVDDLLHCGNQNLAALESESEFCFILNRKSRLVMNILVFV